MKDYTLKKPFTFEAKGGDIQILMLRIKPPTAKVCNLVATLHMEFNKCLATSQEGIMKDMDAEKLRALQEELKKLEREDKEEMSEQDVSQILSLGGADLPNMLDTLRKILVSPNQVKLEDGIELSFTGAVYEEISYNELNRILVFYISNFIEASV